MRSCRSTTTEESSMVWVLRAALLLVGLIHLGPLVGVFGPERLQGLYGLAITEPNLLILMRHRAVMFGLLGGLMLAALFVPRLQPWALVLALVSAAAFDLLVYGGAGGHNANLAKVALVDVAAVVFALAGLAAWYSLRTPGPRPPS